MWKPARTLYFVYSKETTALVVFGDIHLCCNYFGITPNGFYKIASRENSQYEVYKITLKDGEDWWIE